jgi:hypothetical protein
MTLDTWGEVSILSKCQVSSSYGLGVGVSKFERYFVERITVSASE